MVSNLLDDVRFFQPSVQLTKQLVSAIETAHADDLERVRRDEQQVEQDENDMPQDFEVESIRFENGSSNSRVELEEQTLFHQRRFAGELYSYLAFQAESPQAKAGNAMSIKDSVVLGMSVSLGLPERSSLVLQLANEFCAWLQEQGEFIAGWGRVILADSDHMYLEHFHAEPRAQLLTKKVFIPRHSSAVQTKELRLGDIAPDFTAETTRGLIHFHEWLIGHWTCLFSYSGDFNPVSTTELAYLVKSMREFDKRNVKIIGLSVDQAYNHDKWENDIKELTDIAPAFPVISDPNHKIAQLYNLIHPEVGDVLRVGSVFIIGPDKKIKLMITYPARTGRNFDEILRVIDSLQLTALYSVATPVNWQDGDEVIIVPSLSDEDARKKFPLGWRAPKPYLRITSQPNQMPRDKAKAKS